MFFLLAPQKAFSLMCRWKARLLPAPTRIIRAPGVHTNWGNFEEWPNDFPTGDSHRSAWPAKGILNPADSRGAASGVCWARYRERAANVRA
eukprot:gene8157-biopygen1563